MTARNIDISNQILTSVDSFEFTDASVFSSNTITSTNSGIYSSGSGICRLQFDLLSTNYFTQNPDTAFLTFLTRVDTVNLDQSDLRGSGVVFGDVSALPGGTTLNPSTQAITHFSSLDTDTTTGQSYKILPDSALPGTLSDGVTYTFVIDSIRNSDGTAKLRYRVYDAAILLYDSAELIESYAIYDHICFC